MTDYKAYLQKLNHNLNTLREREAKHASNPPVELLNQISDHEQAIALTEQVITAEITEAEWGQALKPLLVSLNQNQPTINQQNQQVGAQINIVGDIQIERFVDRSIDLIDERQKGAGHLFENFVEPIYADFEEIHRQYLESFRHYRHLLTNHQIALPELIDTVHEQYLFTEGQRAKLRKLRGLTDHLLEPFLSAIHAYLTATYDDGTGFFDQRWFRGFLRHLDEIQNFVEYRQQAQPADIAANWRQKRYDEIGQVYDTRAEIISDSKTLEALHGELSSQSHSVSWVEAYCHLNGTDWPPQQAAVAVLDDLIHTLQHVYATVGEVYWKLKIKLLS